MANQRVKPKNIKQGGKIAAPKLKLAENKAQKSHLYYLLFLIALTLIVFFPALSANFISLDDYYYVRDNALIRSLSAQNLKDIWGSPFFANYQPLTIFLYAIEYNLFQLNPHAFHFINVLIHLCNICLVYFVILRIGKKQLVAFITALLFAIHPMHLESVAWVAELKDVLYTFFFLSATLYYLKYVEVKKIGLFYFLSLLMFLLSIISKGQAVILPVALILIDIFIGRKLNKNSIIDKIPYFILSIIFGVVTYQVQKGAGAMQGYEHIPFTERILFASYGLMNYFYKLIIPIHLAIFYPYPMSNNIITSTWVYVSPVIDIAIAFIVFKSFKKNKEVFFGLMFFLVTVFLVIQLIPVGEAVMADRYIYVPSIGLFFITAYYFEKYISTNIKQKNLLMIGGVIYVFILCILSYQRSGVFKDNLSIYTDAIEHNPSATAYNNRGDEYSDRKDHQKAIEDFTNCLALNPGYIHALKNRGLSYERMNNMEMAAKDFEGEIKNTPNDPDSYINFGRALKALNRFDESVKLYTKAISIHPSSSEAYLGRAEDYSRMGKTEQAIDDLSEIIKLNPGNLDPIYSNRGMMYSQTGKPELAIQDFTSAIKLNPNVGNYYMNRSLTLKAVGKSSDALNDAVAARQKGFNVDENYIKELENIVGSKR